MHGNCKSQRFGVESSENQCLRQLFKTIIITVNFIACRSRILSFVTAISCRLAFCFYNIFLVKLFFCSFVKCVKNTFLWVFFFFRFAMFALLMDPSRISRLLLRLFIVENKIFFEFAYKLFHAFLKITRQQIFNTECVKWCENR